MFKPPVFYIQISAKRLYVHNLKSGKIMDEVPEYAVDESREDPVVLGVGNKARLHQAKPGVIISNPFDHPQKLVSDFIAAEDLLKATLMRMQGNGFFQLRPIVVFHPDSGQTHAASEQDFQGMLSMILNAGACNAVIWQGPELNETQLNTLEFPPEGKVVAQS